jgi:3-hydroxyisobutyrate dehydrogenase
MCGHLLAAGYPTVVYSRTRERALNLLERGARCGSTFSPEMMILMI